MNSRATELAQQLDQCPSGTNGWRVFEDLCIEVLEWLFVPPLKKAKIQKRTINGTERRDAVFPNRNLVASSNWGYLHQKHDAELLLFEFKNYDRQSVGPDEILQTSDYLRKTMGRLAFLVCAKPPQKPALRKRNIIHTETQKTIIFLTKEHLKEMLFIKERGEDPSDLILDLIDEFKLQHE